MKQRTNQEAFTTVWNGLVAQGEPSISGSSCKYRKLDAAGNVIAKCAAGMLLDDDDIIYEGRASDFDSGQDGWGGASSMMVRDLQVAHDSPAFAGSRGADWLAAFKDAARKIAGRYHVTVPEDNEPDGSVS